MTTETVDLAPLKTELRRLGCSRSLKIQATEVLIELSRRIQALQEDLDCLQSLLAFQQNSKSVEYKNLRLYKVDDGESHWIAASSPSAAVDYQAHLCGMSSEEYRSEFNPDALELPGDMALSVLDLDTGKSTVRTCAEWANDETEVSIVSTTCC